MTKLEKVIKGLECCALGECPGKECPYLPPPTYKVECVCVLCSDALELLKEQEQEISRLKHHMDCDAAEKLPSGCVGYGRGFNDDEPCETCKACEKYNGYGEE